MGYGAKQIGQPSAFSQAKIVRVSHPACARLVRLFEWFFSFAPYSIREPVHKLYMGVPPSYETHGHAKVSKISLAVTSFMKLLHFSLSLALNPHAVT